MFELGKYLSFFWGTLQKYPFTRFASNVLLGVVMILCLNFCFEVGFQIVGVLFRRGD